MALVAVSGIVPGLPTAAASAAFYVAYVLLLHPNLSGDAMTPQLAGKLLVAGCLCIAPAAPSYPMLPGYVA